MEVSLMIKHQQIFGAGGRCWRADWQMARGRDAHAHLIVGKMGGDVILRSSAMTSQVMWLGGKVLEKVLTWPSIS